MSINQGIKMLCLAAALLMAATCPADTANERAVVNLTLNDGLVGETVHRVMTDHCGGVWIATNSGLNTFNGRQMRTFPLKGDDGWPLEVYDLCETANRQMYLATSDGVWRIVKGDGFASRVFPDVKHPLALLAQGDSVFIGSEQGLHLYDGQQLKHYDVDVSGQGLDNIVRQFVRCDDGRIWFLGRFDLNTLDAQTGKVVRHPLPEPVGRLILTQFACVGNGRFVVGTRGNGLYLCDLQEGIAEHVDGIGNIVTSVQRSSDGHICVATDGAGAYLLTVKGEGLMVKGEGLRVVERFNTEGDTRHRLPSNGIYTYYRDSNGVNWFGFVRYGLAYTYYSGQLFEPFQTGTFKTEGINVRTYCRHDEHVVIGTQNGFHYVNTATGTHRFFSPDDLDGGHIVNNVIWYDGLFYVGTFDNGLRVLDPQSLTLSKQTFSTLLDDISIGDLKVGNDGRLWIGSSHGLMIVSEGKVQQHFTEQNSRIVGGLILSITFDRSGNAWLTGAKGCSLYSVRSRSIVETKFPEGFFNKQPWMRGAQGHDGLVFFRTGQRAFYTNEDMTDFGELQLPVTFKDKWCRSMVDDEQTKHYLLASERGVFAFDYDLKSMIHFGYGEGLRGNFINDMGFEQDGYLWVATSQGLFFASYEKYKAWEQTMGFKVQLCNIRRGSDLMLQNEEYQANDSHEIRLQWNLTSEVLQAELLLPDYAKQTGRIYEYRLGGGEWQHVDDGQSIYVNGLELGKHRLEVRLAGAEGTASVYNIIVVPSGWAVVEAVLLVVALLLLWLWWRFRKTTKVLLTERDEIEDALIESEELRVKSEELADVLGEVTTKYERVKIDEAECADIVKRMKEYLERERVFTNQNLKMKDLADVLHLSAPKLSQVFNIYLGQNYYDFINRYRLEEFKRLIEAGEYKRYTITALSEQCGFKKSNFFSTFRKVEGLTPAEYLKKKGVKMT